ncbi:hypothetical protein LSAT2_012454 [Lamellibrachia satsuma]|nr:hypothetical protein LSAT2_012454 [Lamellibrachia satsuma]
MRKCPLFARSRVYEWSQRICVYVPGRIHRRKLRNSRDLDNDDRKLVIVLDINECESSPCQNSAKCTNLINKYRCTCARGYRGRNCETEIPICDSLPCKNNGHCRENNGNYLCDCVAGYIGYNCETADDQQQAGMPGDISSRR